MLAQTTLAKVKAANVLACGVNFEEAEYSNADAHGNHSAFDFDLCKAVAVAVLGPHATAKIVPYREEKDALAGLKSGEVTMLATASANFINRVHDFGFTAPVLYDFQGLLVNRNSGIHAAADLAGKKVCYLIGSEAEVQIQAFMKRQNVKWLPFPFSEEGEMEAALITHNCDAVSADVTQLAYERIAFHSMASSYEILPDVVAKDPLAIAFRQDDLQWANLLRSVAASLVQAEESSVTSANLAEKLKSTDPVVMRLLGTAAGYGQYLGLDDAWGARVIAAVGNYGEMYERTLGSRSPMRLTRGVNALWTNGGLMYAEPVR